MIRLLPLSLALVLATGVAASAQDDPVVAIVDGTEFRLSDLEQTYRELPEQFRQMPLEALYEPLVDRLIDGELILRAAEASNLAEDSEVQAAIERARDDVLRQAVIEEAVEEATSDEAIAAAYEEMKAQPDFIVEQITASHILVETEEEASELIAELDAGADFAELAQEHSLDPGSANGGELGTFRRGAMVPAFEEAAFALEPGTYSSEPVETQFGYHVILVSAKEQTEPALAEVEQQIRADLTRNAIEGLLETMREGAEVTRFNMDGTPIE